LLVTVFVRNTKGVEDEEGEWIAIEELFTHPYENEELESVINYRKTVVWDD
jgi:hypothetical protein